MILFVNITVEFFLCFIKEEWVQKIYHLSDDAQCAHVIQWKLCMACCVGIDKFEVSELYSSVMSKSIVLDDGAAVLEKNDDIHHALSRSSSNTPPPGHDMVSHQNGPDKIKSPHASKYQQIQEEQFEKRMVEVSTSLPTQSNPHNNSYQYNHNDASSNHYSNRGVDAANSSANAITMNNENTHVKPEYYLLRAFVELGIQPITVACLRYSHRFLDRKKQFAQVFKYIADQNMESILCGESCEMVYKQPKEFVHVWTLCDETDSSSEEEMLMSEENNVAQGSKMKRSKKEKEEKDKTNGVKKSDSSLPMNLPTLKDNNSSSDIKLGRRSSQGSPFFRSSFIALNLGDLLLTDVRVKQDKGVFNLVRSTQWKVENIERLEVMDKEKMVIDVEDFDDEESKDEEIDQFGDDIICRAQCVYFST